jgi:rfaE bifunctional protein nucleotidyltransferase chain/domain
MLISQALAQTIATEIRNEGKTLVFTNGCFDILHVGHTTYLEKAATLGNILLVGVNSDASVRRLKGGKAGAERPINTERDRATVLSALRSVDYTCIFDDDTPLDLIELVQPDVLVKGGDYTPETIVGADIVRARGGRVVVIPFVEGKSTTQIVNRILER